MTSRLLKFAAGMAASAFLASGAAAQSIDLSIAPAQEQSVPNSAAAPESATDTSPFAIETAASTETLGRLTAREDISLVSNSQQASTVTGNSVNGTSTTGDISFSDNAFQNASGLTVINANSGNNVSMNASMNVNIVMAPTASPQP